MPPFVGACFLRAPVECARIQAIGSCRLRMGLFKDRTPVPQPLGPLEVTVMEILWARGESNVRDVVDRLDRPLAYTTVMTTLDRLFKKGLLARRKFDRAFLYSPTLNRTEWEHKRAGDFVAGFLSVAEPSRDLLISCLVEAVGRHDEALLDELQKKIKLRRKELCRRPKP
jgi:predicted transcriptional regulator